MLAETGLVTIFLAFLASIYATVASAYGGWRHNDKLVQSARNAALMTFPLILIACTVLTIALMTGEYQINYVRNTTDPQTPDFYRFTALWGSQEGSLLFWCLVMTIFTTLPLIISWKQHRRLMPYVITYMMASLTFFLFLVVFLENPFERAWIVQNGAETSVQDALLIPPNAYAPTEQNLANNAQGLNPLLRHFGMIIHPPMLYLGFVGFLVPFAFAMAALASGDLSTNWIKATRRWTLVAWLFLSLGLILGGRWAYDVLGWGGYWGWDPVENAAFLPWLIGTAFLHSVLIQEKRGMLKVWNMFLIIFTFSAVMFGTFATRSGLVSSVHSFAESEIGVPMFLFWGSITLISVAMLLWRWNQGLLEPEHHLTGWFSREAMFLLNNVIFVALAVAIFWGSFGAPILSELQGQTITLGVDYFMTVTPPLFAIMYVLMGVAPLTAWGATSLRGLNSAPLLRIAVTGLVIMAVLYITTNNPIATVAYGVVLFAGAVAVYEIYRGTRARMRARGENPLVAFTALFTRNRRRYGGYIVHLGIVVIGIGVIGSTIFQVERQETLNVGETMSIPGGYELTFDEYAVQIAEDGRVIDRAFTTITRNGNFVRELGPRIDYFPQTDGSTMPMTIAGAHSTLENDFYVLMIPNRDTAVFDRATFKVYVNPLVNLVWWGGLILILGTFISTWPNDTVPASVREKSKSRTRTNTPGAGAGAGATA